MASGNNSSLNPGYSPEAIVVFAISVTLIMLFTIVGNILVIIAVLTHRPLRGPQNLFLVSLAAADILLATLVMPFSLANELMGYWYFEPLWCDITLALDVFFCTSSIIHLCTISLDRYLSISRPIQYGTKRTPRKIKGAIVVVWLISAIISFPPLVSMLSVGNETGNEKNSTNSTECKLNEEVWYILYSCIGSFFVPCLIMILVYVRIYQIAKKHTRCPPGEPRKEGLDIVPAVQNGRDEAIAPAGASNVLNKPQPAAASQQKTKRSRASEDSSSSGSDGEVIAGHVTNGATSNKEPGHKSSSQSQTHRNVIATPTGSQLASPNTKSMGPQNTRRKAMLVREKRFTFVLAVVIGVFIVCWFPFFFTYTLKAICGKACEAPETVFTTFFWLGYCNSALNPLIYTIFNRDFRRAFRKILCKSCKDCSL